MARLPLPPTIEALAAISPAWRVLPAGALLWRVYFHGGPHPTTWKTFRTFGPTGARFDHHTYPKREQNRGILYAAQRSLTCFAEVFQRAGVVDLTTNAPFIVAFRTTAPLRLLDLSGHWPTVAGASMAINSGSHARARAWSRIIYATYPETQGLWYCSSMDENAPCVALYERAADAMPVTPSFHAPLADPRLRVMIDRHAVTLNYLVISPRSMP